MDSNEYDVVGGGGVVCGGGGVGRMYMVPSAIISIPAATVSSVSGMCIVGGDGGGVGGSVMIASAPSARITISDGFPVTMRLPSLVAVDMLCLQLADFFFVLRIYRLIIVFEGSCGCYSWACFIRVAVEF